MTARTRYVAILIVVWATLSLALGCRPELTRRNVVILADGKDIALFTNVRTVREALAEAKVTIDEDDLVEPDLWVQLEDGLTVRVTRAQEEIIVEREVLPYKEQTIKSEALASGERKLLQVGKNGEIEVTYRVQFEDGVEVSRGVVRQQILREPLNQITVVGVEGVVDSVQVPGTIAYLNSGNAWVMRVTSGGRHPVTTAGNLDGHVFALSPDGTHLLYTVLTETVQYDGTFNELYLLNVVVIDEKPRRLPMANVLWADWSPNGNQIAYSTGDKSGSPGWKANNDLWLATLFDSRGNIVQPTPKRVLSPQTSSAYSWWGSKYAWSPDGRKIAYTRPDQVGYLDLQTRRAFPLAPFPPLNAHRDWVWIPTPSWSPDSTFIVSTIHGTEPGRPAEESQRFEVWALDLSNTVRARLTHSVGMWSLPRWSPDRSGDSLIAYAEAELPLNSYDSRYTLKVMDRDGSNKRTIFPIADGPGITPPVEYDWSNTGMQLVILYLGDLYLLDMVSGMVHQLTGDGQSTALDWET